jgi:hypothetical protein
MSEHGRTQQNAGGGRCNERAQRVSREGDKEGHKEDNGKRAENVHVRVIAEV